MFKKIFSFFAALTLSVGLWAANSVITFTSTSKLYPYDGDPHELMMDESKWEAFKAQFPEFAEYGSYMEFEMMMMMMEHRGGELSFFNPNAFLDANDQVLNYTYNYDDATQIGTITFAGELVTMYGVSGDDVHAFSGCSSLTSITLPEGLTSIGEYSFYFCNNLTTVNLPASLTTIGNHAFDACSNLTSVNFATGSQLTTIGEYVFNGCQVLTTLSIPASVTEIKRWTIRACTSLNDVYVAWTTTLPTLGVAVFDATPVSSATLHVPAGTKALYQDADQWKNFGNIVEPAPTPVSTTYIDENGEEQNIDAWEVKDASAAVTWGTAGNTTWYVVKGNNVQLSKGAVCAGDVRLILADGAKLTATGGINVTGTNSLTIYGQSTGDEMGQLIADATSVGSAAGIGGGGDGENGSNITINGGIVTATGGNEGAGIGGGQIGAGANITINGGKVTATGGIGAAGIGGGNYGAGSYITINGGVVTANGGDMAAGIGGGYGESGSNITINGGTVEAIGGMMAAGIGGGRYASGSNITINGGKVTATGQELAAGIGGGYNGSGSNIYISDAYVLKAGADADNTTVIAHSSAQDIASSLNGKLYAKIEGLATPYTRSMTIDNWATVCLPYASTVFSGAKFYRVNYYDGDTKLYIEEVSSLVAGQPYIFQATAETVTIEHAGVATLTYGEEQKDRGLQGLFARTIIATDGSQAALSNNTVQWLESDFEITVPACRAYFDMNDVPRVEQPHSAPLRCIRVPRQTPTDFENVTLDEDATKILRNGQLIIIRDGKEYNAQGMQL